jgi:hypothetical protein
VLDPGAAVHAGTGNAHQREFDRQDVALFTARIIAGCAKDWTQSAVRKGLSIEARGFFRVVIEPKKNSVFCDHVSSPVSIE